MTSLPLRARLALIAGGCALVLAAAIPGCSSEATPEKRGPLTERERDSTLGASGLPGGVGVTRALAVSDSAAARAARALPDHY
jgi:hypothetical protein